MKNETKAAIIRFVKAINDHNVNDITDLLTDDYVFIDAMDKRSIGKKGMDKAWSDYFVLFPDFLIEISEIPGIPENGSPAALFGYVQATYKNMTNDLNSNFWRIPAAWKVIVENKRIKHWQVYCDYSSLLMILDKNR